MADRSTADLMTAWPDASREAAQLVVDTYGEPDEMTETTLVWHRRGPWKRIVATKASREFSNVRRGEPTPYMDGFQFAVPTGGTADPDERALSDAQLEAAKQEGAARSR